MNENENESERIEGEEEELEAEAPEHVHGGDYAPASPPAWRSSSVPAGR